MALGETELPPMNGYRGRNSGPYYVIIVKSAEQDERRIRKMSEEGAEELGG
jgi:hypothetical protein